MQVGSVGLLASVGTLFLALYIRRRLRALPSEEDDDGWFALCHAHRLRRRQRPSQSGFRVTALVTYQLQGKSSVRHVVGHNDEACNLHNSVCAERGQLPPNHPPPHPQPACDATALNVPPLAPKCPISKCAIQMSDPNVRSPLTTCVPVDRLAAAFLQLAGIAQQHDIIVRTVYISTDAPEALAPGALCREYMLSSRWTTPSTRVLMAGSSGALATRRSFTLEELWPLASVHTRLDRAAQLAQGRCLEPILRDARDAATGAEAIAWRAALAACERDARPELHPMSYGASVVFEDGTVACASQRKALEYGCSLDAVCLLTTELERASSAPVMLCMCDQFGLCHAPFAPARAYLAEHGWGHLRLMAHDAVGQMHVAAVADLLPNLPSWCGSAEPSTRGSNALAV